MTAIKFSQDIRPVTDLKSHGADLVQQVTEEGRPVVLSKHGRAVAVLLSVEEYEGLQDQLARAEVRRAVADAEGEIDAGHGLAHAVVVRRLQKMTDSDD